MSGHDRIRVRREPQRGRYDRETIDGILDEALFCPPASSSGGRVLRHAGTRAPMCATVPLLDGLVLAKSVFNHSINYRSVVVLGEAHEVDGEEKRGAVPLFPEPVAPGRWEEARQPTPTELKATAIFALPLDEASAKV